MGLAGANGDVDVDPGYVDPADGDLAIPTTSPVAYAGTATGAPTVDVNGAAWGGVISMGAFAPVVVDAGAPDAGPPDAGPADAEAPDAAPYDAGAPDAGPEAGPPDAGPVPEDAGDGGDAAIGFDSSFPDTNPIVVTVPYADCACLAAGDASGAGGASAIGGIAALAFSFVARRRRR